MAGIYIPGVETLNCDECFWCIGHRIKCPAGSKDVLVGGRHPNCPIRPVPKHGRLIDADKYEYPGDLVYEPTIIPADPAEEGET